MVSVAITYNYAGQPATRCPRGCIWGLLSRGTSRWGLFWGLGTNYFGKDYHHSSRRENFKSTPIPSISPCNLRNPAPDHARHGPRCTNAQMRQHVVVCSIYPSVCLRGRRGEPWTATTASVLFDAPDTELASYSESGFGALALGKAGPRQTE